VKTRRDASSEDFLELYLTADQSWQVSTRLGDASRRVLTRLQVASFGGFRRRVCKRLFLLRQSQTSTNTNRSYGVSFLD